MLSLPNDSYMFRPVAPAAAPHSHPLQEVEMETYTGSISLGMDSGGDSREMGPGREDGQMGNWAAWQGGWEAKTGATEASGHAVQMHPCPRPGHLCSLATPGAPRLLPGPVSRVLPSQGQRPPLCPFTPGYTPLSEPLADTLQTGKGNLHLTHRPGEGGLRGAAFPQSEG